MRVFLISMAMMVIATADTLAQDEAAMTSHERVAAELIEILQVEKASMASVDVVAQIMNDQNPMVAELMRSMAEFSKESLKWEDLKLEYIRLYTQAFTEDELREIIVFYESPVGQKTIELTPVLMMQVIEFRQKQMQKHLPDLQRRIRVRADSGAVGL